MQKEWGAHAPSRSLFRAFAERKKRADITRFWDLQEPSSDRQGQRSEHARAHVLPETNRIPLGIYLLSAPLARRE